VAERTKVSIATHTDAGLIPRPWAAFIFEANHGVCRTSVTIPHPGMAETYGCPNQKFSQNKHTRVNKSTIPSPTVPQTNDLVIEALNLNKKKYTF